MVASIISVLGALAAIILSILDSRNREQQRSANARYKVQESALEHAAAGDPDGAVSDVLGMPDR